jgi:hypothetical protein
MSASLTFFCYDMLIIQLSSQYLLPTTKHHWRISPTFVWSFCGIVGGCSQFVFAVGQIENIRESLNDIFCVNPWEIMLTRIVSFFFQETIFEPSLYMERNFQKYRRKKIFSLEQHIPEDWHIDKLCVNIPANHDACWDAKIILEYFVSQVSDQLISILPFSNSK